MTRSSLTTFGRSACALVVTLAGAAALAAPERPKLRVCADPNNLPFSSAREDGLENALARLVARALAADLEYAWQPQRRGFVRNTLAAQTCDVMMEAPVGYGRALVTRPYYRSSYVFLSRRDRRLGLRSFDDPTLRRLRIGVQVVGDDYANPPAAAALGARGLGQQVVGYPVYGDYSAALPQSPIVDAVVRGEIDVAVVWGPLAGWLARRSPVPLALAPVRPAAPPFTFDIGMAVRRGDEPLRRRLDAVIHDHQREIDQLLRRFGVPLLARAARR